jgi:hypothetical protein
MTPKNKILKAIFHMKHNTKCLYGEIIVFYQNAASISSIAYSKKKNFYFALPFQLKMVYYHCDKASIIHIMDVL